jgi:DNA polymerase-1
MNAPIQGTAADIMKICMIKVDKFLKEDNYKTKVVLQIHDELIFKVPKEEKDFIVPLLKEVMENCVELKVKLEVEGSLAKTWYDCK